MYTKNSERVFANKLEPFRILKSIYDIKEAGNETFFSFKKNNENLYKCDKLPNFNIEFKKSSYKGNVGSVAILNDEINNTYISSKFIKKVVVFSIANNFISNLDYENIGHEFFDYKNYSSSKDYILVDVIAQIPIKIYGDYQNFVFSQPKKNEIVFTDFAYLRTNSEKIKFSAKELKKLKSDIKENYKNNWNSELNLMNNDYIRF